MGELRRITKCRICKSDKLADAFGIDSKRYYVVCKVCTTLQRKEDILYSIDINFEGRKFELDYYPAFLKNHDTTPMTEDVCIFFSLGSIEYVLNKCGYEVVDAAVVGYKLHVLFEPFTMLKKIRNFEKKQRLNNQYTFFLWAIQLKK